MMDGYDDGFSQLPYKRRLADAFVFHWNLPAIFKQTHVQTAKSFEVDANELGEMLLDAIVAELQKRIEQNRSKQRRGGIA